MTDLAGPNVVQADIDEYEFERQRSIARLREGG